MKIVQLFALLLQYLEEEFFVKPLAICADGGGEIVTKQINESVLVVNQKNVDFSSLDVQTLAV